MIDIETYRRKIGGFTSSRHRKEGKKQKKDITPGKFHIRYNIGTMSLLYYYINVYINFTT